MFEKITKRIEELTIERAQLLIAIQSQNITNPAHEMQKRVWHIEGMLEVYAEAYENCRCEMARGGNY